MPCTVLRSREATRDLDDLWFFVAQQDVAAADRLLDRIEEEIDLLRGFPRLGRERDDLIAGLRGKLAGSILILYRHDVQAKQVRILRIVDARRDLTTLFQE